MAVTIKLKNASGSDPSASDLVVGEIAIRTDTAKLFTKKDDNSVAEIGATVGSDAVDTAAIQDDAVTQAKIAAGAVGRTEIATAAISSDEIDAGQVTTAKIGDLAVSTAKLGNDAVTSAKIADDSINSEHYVDGSIDTAHIADDQVTYAKIQNVSATNRILGRDSSGAGVIEEITPANLRTMLNVADGATNVTNTNQLTNGAGFITATLTNEQVQDIVGGMVSGNTESGITVTYQDSDGTLDFSVSSQTDENFTTTLKNKLDGIASGATNVTNTNQLTNGAGFITATLTNEQVQDIVGGMLTGNTETGITVTYQDSDGTIDFVVGTLNQDTTGNAATATALETARTIGGTSFDGTSNITPAQCTNADTVDSLHASSFIRSDADDSFTGTITATCDTANPVFKIQGSGPNFITFASDSSGTVDSDSIDLVYRSSPNTLGFERSSDNTILFTVDADNGQAYFLGNLDVAGGLDVTGNITVTGNVDGRDVASDGSKLDGIESGATADQSASEILTLIKTVDGAGSGLAADVVDGLHASSFIRSDAADTASSEITFNGGISVDGKAAANIVSVSDASTITLNMNSGTHHAVTLGGNRTFAAPSNQNVGQSGSIFITQDGTGSRTASFNSAFKFVGGSAPTLSTSANAVDRIDYVIKSSNVIHCAVSLDVK